MFLHLYINLNIKVFEEEVKMTCKDKQMFPLKEFNSDLYQWFLVNLILLVILLLWIKIYIHTSYKYCGEWLLTQSEFTLAHAGPTLFVFFTTQCCLEKRFWLYCTKFQVFSTFRVQYQSLLESDLEAICHVTLSCEVLIGISMPAVTFRRVCSASALNDAASMSFWCWIFCSFSCEYNF